MIAVEEAIHLILDQIHPLGRERLNILQSLGRVLGEDIFARRHIPPWDNSAMDGYAVRWQDIQKASSRKGEEHSSGRRGCESWGTGFGRGDDLAACAYRAFGFPAALDRLRLRGPA